LTTSERKETVKLPRLNQRRIRQELTHETAQNNWTFTEGITTVALESFLDFGASAMNYSFLASIRKQSALTSSVSTDIPFPSRHHDGGFIDFSAADIQFLKSQTSASTQVALVSYLLQALWRLCGEKSKPESNGIIFWLSGRHILERGNQQLELDYVDNFGNFLILQKVHVKANLETASLAEISAQIDAGLKPISDPQEVAKRLLRVENTGSSCMMQEFGKLLDETDLGYLLKINNLSKLPLPDWGQSSITQRILTMAGPNVLLATPQGGIRCYFESSAFKNNTTAAQICKNFK